MQFDLDIRPVGERAIGGGLEGAERTSRETVNWSAAIISPDRQINPVKDEADARSRDSVQNNGYVSGAVQTHKDSIVGSQYRLNATPDIDVLGADDGWAEEWQRVVEARCNTIFESQECWIDASRRLTFTDHIRLGVASFCMTGEVLNTVEWIRDSTRPFQTAIQGVLPIRLSNPDNRQDEFNLRKGVKSDFFGAPVGYYFRKTHPTDFFFDGYPQYEWAYVPARKPWGRRQVIHIIEALQPEQTRGISDMVAVLKQMRMTRRFNDVALQNAVINATYAAAVESELPKEMVYSQMGGGQSNFTAMLGEYMTGLEAYLKNASNIQIDGVKIPHFFPGTKLNIKPMGTPGGIGTEFESSLLRHTAAGLNLSFEEFARDFSKTNYSSIKAGMAQTGRYMAGRKKSVADKQATQIFQLIMEEEINAGNVPLPKGFTIDTFYKDVYKKEALLSCEWIGASSGQVDEMKETQAALMRIKGLLSTHEQENAKLGKDWRKTFRQRAREEKMIKELGLPVALDATKQGNNDAQSTMRDQTDEG